MVRTRLLWMLPLLAVGAAPAGSGAEKSLLRVQVRDESGRPLPCRMTLVDGAGSLVETGAAPNPGLALRTGVVYTLDGKAELRPGTGRFTLYVNRGMEYGMVRREVELAAGSRKELRFTLRREVDTRGWVACDPHIHTLTHSGHGDATVAERLVTLAGEGVELAIATDHNHHTEYAPAARQMGADGHFTSMIGNEVTTAAGHFNAFPIKPGVPPPDHRTTDWNQLFARIRATPGVRVVILNHPSNDHANYIPTDPVRFHPASGESRDGRPWSFDGIEVVTSAALQSDQMKPYRDWFALLNRGLRLSGYGSSDSHEVNRYIVGQGRTYVAADDRRPEAVSEREACDAMLAGKVSSSMGLFVEALVGDRRPGWEPVTVEGKPKVRVRVQGPRWVTADRLDLFVNGRKVVSRPISHAAQAVVKADVTLTVPRLPQDAWVVAVASGPGIEAPYWPIPRPYQPRWADWEPRVMGATNPLRLDLDGRPGYSSPLDEARAAVRASGGDPARLTALLANRDEATAVQAAALCREQGLDLESAPFRRAIEGAPPAVRHGFVAYLRLLK